MNSILIFSGVNQVDLLRLKKVIYLYLACMLVSASLVAGKVEYIAPKNTLTIVELDHNDEIAYELRCGRVVHLKIIDSNVDVIFSTIDLPAEGKFNDISVFKMECTLLVNGQEMTMVRYVPVQESFYEPYNVNGLRIWFDALKSLDEVYNENHGDCLPGKQVRLALHDADIPICPEEITAWCNLPDNFLDIKLAYNGENAWLGTYFGTDLHGGLDINMPSNSPLWAPISIDYNYTFNSFAAGQGNNRWRAYKYWENGDTWILQTHHHNELIIPEFKESERGTKYAYTAGTSVDEHPHTHFIFKVKQPGKQEYFIDPWIIFWQILENNKIKSGAIKARIKTVAPGKTGASVYFDASESSSGLGSITPKYHWSFGDGGYSIARTPRHIYQKPGIYPVTLTVFNGLDYASTTQHVIIDGTPTNLPEFKAVQENNISFFKRRPWEMDAYGHTNGLPLNTISFTLPHYSKNEIDPQEIIIEVVSSDFMIEEGSSNRIEVNYIHGKEWLDVEVLKKSNADSIFIKLSPKIENLIKEVGKSEAYLVIHNEGVINSPYLLKTEVSFERYNRENTIIIDNEDKGCVKSNYFWVTKKQNAPYGLTWNHCVGESFLMSSGDSDDDFIRYIPKISEGRYQVSLHSPLYKHEKYREHAGGFHLHISSRDGVETKWINPSESTFIGEFDFNTCEGYVEITSKGADGLIIADAIIFEKIN